MNEILTFANSTEDLAVTIPGWDEQYQGSDFPLPTIGEMMVLMHVQAEEPIQISAAVHCVSMLANDRTMGSAFASELSVKFLRAVIEWNGETVPQGKAAGYKYATSQSILDVLRQIGTGTIDGREKRNDLLLEGMQILTELRKGQV